MIDCLFEELLRELVLHHTLVDEVDGGRIVSQNGKLVDTCRIEFSGHVLVLLGLIIEANPLSAKFCKFPFSRIHIITTKIR